MACIHVVFYIQLCYKISEDQDHLALWILWWRNGLFWWKAFAFVVFAQRVHTSTQRQLEFRMREMAEGVQRESESYVSTPQPKEVNDGHVNVAFLRFKHRVWEDLRRRGDGGQQVVDIDFSCGRDIYQLAFTVDGVREDSFTGSMATARTTTTSTVREGSFPRLRTILTDMTVTWFSSSLPSSHHSDCIWHHAGNFVAVPTSW